MVFNLKRTEIENDFCRRQTVPRCDPTIISTVSILLKAFIKESNKSFEQVKNCLRTLESL
jgi:hypothetical protein